MEEGGRGWVNSISMSQTGVLEHDGRKILFADLFSKERARHNVQQLFLSRRV